jgi:hydrogenase maturation factor
LMCLTRVGRIVNIEGSRAEISYLDNREKTEVDVSMVDARKGSYVEIFANVAIGRITKKEADHRQALQLELRARAKGVDS